MSPWSICLITISNSQHPFKGIQKKSKWMTWTEKANRCIQCCLVSWLRHSWTQMGARDSWYRGRFAFPKGWRGKKNAWGSSAAEFCEFQKEGQIIQWVSGRLCLNWQNLTVLCWAMMVADCSLFLYLRKEWHMYQGDHKAQNLYTFRRGIKFCQFIHH